MTQYILDTIMSVQPKQSAEGSSGETRESNVLRQTNEMLAKVPRAYDPFEVKSRLHAMGITESMNIFLKQEIDRMQLVIQLVQTTLKELLLAIDGSIVMNEVFIIISI